MIEPVRFNAAPRYCSSECPCDNVALSKGGIKLLTLMISCDEKVEHYLNSLHCPNVKEPATVVNS